MQLPDDLFNLEKTIRNKSLKELKSFCNHYMIDIDGKYATENLRETITKWFKDNYGY